MVKAINVEQHAFPAEVTNDFNVEGLKSGKYVYGTFTNTNINAYGQKLTSQSLEKATPSLTKKNQNSLNFAHDGTKTPIGKVIRSAFKNGESKYLAEIYEDNQRAIEIYNAVEAGFVEGCSPTFSVEAMNFDNADESMAIDVGEFYELSLTQIPVNTGTTVKTLQNSIGNSMTVDYGIHKMILTNALMHSMNIKHGGDDKMPKEKYKENEKEMDEKDNEDKTPEKKNEENKKNAIDTNAIDKLAGAVDKIANSLTALNEKVEKMEKHNIEAEKPAEQPKETPAETPKAETHSIKTGAAGDVGADITPEKPNMNTEGARFDYNFNGIFQHTIEKGINPATNRKVM